MLAGCRDLIVPQTWGPGLEWEARGGIFVHCTDAQAWAQKGGGRISSTQLSVYWSSGEGTLSL